MLSGLDTVVIADDLTGAADTGVQFAAIGSPVYLMPVETLSLGRPWMAWATGISVYTATRHLRARAAAQRLRLVAAALSGLRPRWVYKKIDSCLRGNLGAEIDVLLDALRLDAALIAPALPAQGRTTVGGIHRVYGTPLAETGFAKDLVTPVSHSAIADVLGYQSQYSVGRIDVNEYGDPWRLQQAVRRERRRGCRLIVCDAAVQEHLDQVATLVVASQGRLLPVGSAGLAVALGRQLPLGGACETQSELYLERLLFVCGTGSRVTRGQVDALPDRHPGFRRELQPQWLIKSSARDRRRCAAEMLDAWTKGVLALQIRPLPPRGPAVSPGRAVVGLAELASEIIRAGRVDGLFLSGGETADAFRRASGAEAIRLEREILPGLVLGLWLGGVAEGLPVITKAGAFGREQTLVALHRRLSGGNTR